MKDFARFSIEGVTKRYGEKTALADFSLSLERGEFVTFLGPSGCGKSTALACIAGLIPITSGRISIDDECIDDAVNSVPPEKRGFGMVFQNYALFPHLSVYNNVAFGLKLRKLAKSAIAEKVLAALRLVHLEGYAEKFPAQMSGGEQQRVAIARCIVLEPRLLMLDEPLSNLDAKLRIEMRYEIKALHERLHVSSIYVTHDQQEALALSDRIVVMRLGHIQQIGTPEEVYAAPSNLFVADFMGFKNIWPARIATMKGGSGKAKLTLDVGGMTVEAAVERTPAIAEAFERKLPVCTAIRPEDLHVKAAAGESAIKATVDQIEYLGQSSQVTASAGEGVRIDLRTTDVVHERSTIMVGVAPDRILVFPEEA